MMTEDLVGREGSAPTVAVLMTCFNRRVQTLACLSALFAQQSDEPRSMQVFLVDDGSSDGTGEAVRARYPGVRVIAGSGQLFWNGGMRVAFAEAAPQAYDFILWLNDDTLLLPAALDVLLGTARGLAGQGIAAIVAGSTQDRATGRRSYGGERTEQRWFTRRTVPVEPHRERPMPCDTMNGNCTLVPRQIAQCLGNLDAAFTHSFGDTDYGYRARAAGFSIYITPGFLGTCSDNPRAGTWRDRSASFVARWSNLNSAKGSPFFEWTLYCRRHLGPLWPVYAVSPYVKTLVTGLLPRRVGV